MERKPQWAIDRDRARKAGPEPVWLFGLHAVRDALANPARRHHRLVMTKNAADRLQDVLGEGRPDGVPEPEMADPRRCPAPLDPGSVHQGAALLVDPLDWGGLDPLCLPDQGPPPLVVLLDRVTDPHNVGAILRSAEVFGARAVIAPRRHAAPETGALAKAASGALERQPYVRVQNLSRAMGALADMGYLLIGLDGQGQETLVTALAETGTRPIALVLGAEGPGLRQKTTELCDRLVRIDPAGAFGSLNVSNAAAVSLFAASENIKKLCE